MTNSVTRPARSSTLPEGVVVTPRRFAFEGLDDVPQYWFADNPVSTHVENTFSILIPPGERFFIRSVRHFADRVADDPGAQALIRAFTQQEAYHTKAHVELNASFARFGVDIPRHNAYAQRWFDRLERILPGTWRLGVTAFLEHLTATAAQLLFTEPMFEELIHPELLRFWRWHAIEELEHKAVAFDLFGRVGGRYWLRVTSALVALSALAVPYAVIANRMIRDDPHQPTREERRQALALDRQLLLPQLKLVLRYFKPGFHPWDADDRRILADWYEAERAGSA